MLQAEDNNKVKIVSRWYNSGMVTVYKWLSITLRRVYGSLGPRCVAEVACTRSLLHVNESDQSKYFSSGHSSDYLSNRKQENSRYKQFGTRGSFALQRFLCGIFATSQGFFSPCTMDHVDLPAYAYLKWVSDQRMKIHHEKGGDSGSSTIVGLRNVFSLFKPYF